MQVGTAVWRNIVVMASGNPFKPSTTAIKISVVPRAFSSFNNGTNFRYPDSGVGSAFLCLAY